MIQITDDGLEINIGRTEIIFWRPSEWWSHSYGVKTVLPPGSPYKWFYCGRFIWVARRK